ncbi:hypothetical protein YC2023_017249 [Brassica napus]
MFITNLVRVLVVITVTLENITFLRSETKNTNHSSPTLASHGSYSTATPRSNVSLTVKEEQDQLSRTVLELHQ